MSDTVTIRTRPRGPEQLPSPTARTVKRLLRQPITMIAVLWLLVVLVCAVTAPLLAPFDPNDNDFTAVLQGPSAEHLLGTDENGRDVLSRIIFGARIALLVGVGSVIIAALIGIPLGLLLGFRGGWYDRIGTRFIDIFDALPGMLVAFAVIAILGRGMLPIMLAIGLIFCMNIARMTRAVTLAERGKIYVDAGRVSGLREVSLLFRQVLPNITGPLIVQGAILVGSAITIEAALSFLSIGLESTTPSWGGLLGVAVTKMAVQPFMIFPPGIAIVLTVLAFNMLADGVSQALGSQRRRRLRRTDRAAARAAGAVGAAAAPDADAVLQVDDLTVTLFSEDKRVPLVTLDHLTVGRGEVVGVIGESGSGKSTFARAVLGLLAPNLHITGGTIRIDGKDMTHAPPSQWRKLRGGTIAAVFQDPMASLSPVHTVGAQLVDTLRAHRRLSRRAARVEAAALLERVGVRGAAKRLDEYPHQFSGGMAQRVAIAIALASEPALLVADEATSALDVTTQAQVLDLLLDLRDEYGMGILLITHDMGVVAEVCDRAAVVYSGSLVELTDVKSLFDAPQDPYTVELLAARERRPRTIEARVPASEEVTS